MIVSDSKMLEMKPDSITFVPIGGLCNRMRAMASGVYMAGRLDCPIDVYWEKNGECFAGFSELFQPVCVDGVLIRPFTAGHFYLAMDRKRNLHIPGMIRNVLFDRQIVDKNRFFSDSAIEQLDGKLYIISEYPMSQKYSLTGLFVPAPDIMAQVNSLKEQFSEDIIGIHIRRKDNKHSIEKNSIEDYFHFMDQKLSKSPDSMFYLATDSMEVKKEMISRYKDTIIYHDATLERNSVQGMKDAVVDLWCLSQTKEIIGSYYSSYSDIAAELGHIKLRILE